MNKKTNQLLIFAILVITVISAVVLLNLNSDEMISSSDVSNSKSLQDLEKYYDLQFPKDTKILKALSLNDDKHILLKVEMAQQKIKEFEATILEKDYCLVEKKYMPAYIKESFIDMLDVDDNGIGKLYVKSEDRTVVGKDGSKMGITQNNLILFYKSYQDKQQIILYR